MGGSAICGTESSARGDGGRAGAVALVERSGALWARKPLPDTGDATLESAMERAPVARFSRGGGIVYGIDRAAAVHAHRTAVGRSGVRGSLGSIDIACISGKKGPSEEKQHQICTSSACLRLRDEENGVSPVCPSFP